MTEDVDDGTGKEMEAEKIHLNVNITSLFLLSFFLIYFYRIKTRK